VTSSAAFPFHQRVHAKSSLSSDTEIGREKLALLKLDVAERERRVIPAADVRTCWLTIAATVRNKILGLARKVAPRIAGLRSAAEVEAALYPECCEALEELASMTITMGASNGKQRDESIGA
jgi:hypothetical protein